jgi:hypothetical protein
MPQMVSISDPWRSSRYVAIPTRKHPTGEITWTLPPKGRLVPKLQVEDDIQRRLSEMS